MEYKITAIEPRVDIDPTGKFIKVYRVYFRYKDIEDYIDVPESEYSEENVKKKIEQIIKTHTALLSK